jgi:hypothetical protein
MPAQQTSYNNNPAAAYNGMLTGLTQNRVTMSKVAQGTVPIGCLCQFGSTSFSVPAPLISTPTSGDSGTVIQFAGSANNPLLDSDFLGIPYFDSGLMQTSQITTVGTGANAFSAFVNLMPVGVLRKGFIWVLTENAVSQGGNVFVRVTADGTHQIGQFSGSAGGGVATWSRGRWLMTTTSGGLAQMEVW